MQEKDTTLMPSHRLCPSCGLPAKGERHGGHPPPYKHREVKMPPSHTMMVPESFCVCSPVEEPIQ